MNRHLKLSTASLAVLAALPALAVEERDYLPPQIVTARLADGVPWSAESPEGRTFKLTLNKDGTGSVRGPLWFKLSTTWEVKGEAMCLTNTMMSKCLRFRDIPGGFQSWNEDKPDLKFTR